METTQEEIEAIDSAQASIEQALENAVATMNSNESENAISLETSATDLSKSAGLLLTPPSDSVNTWAESKFPDIITASAVDQQKAEIKDEIPSSDNDFGGDTDDDLSYLDLSHVTAPAPAQPEPEPEPEKPKSPEKPKETAIKPKGKGSKRGRKGKDKQVKAETEAAMEKATTKEPVSITKHLRCIVISVLGTCAIGKCTCKMNYMRKRTF